MAEVEYNQYIFTWKIKNFLSSYLTDNHHYESPYFPCNYSDSSIEWNVRLYPRGTLNIEDSKDKISVLFVRRYWNPSSSKIINLNVTIEVVDTNSCVLMSTEYKKCEAKKFGIYCFVCFQNYEMFCELLKNRSEDTLTIRCIITRSDVENKILPTIGSEAITIIDVNRFFFKWDVSNTGCFDWTESMSVPNSIMPDSKITLSAPNDAIDVSVQLLNKSSLPITIVFRMTVLSATGSRLASKCEVHLFDSLKSFQFPTFMSKNDLCFGNSSPSCYKYTLICECNVSKKSCSSTFSSFTISSFVKNEIPASSLPSSLHKDFRKLIMNKKYSDVRLKVGEKEFFAHKAVLGTRSSVF